MHRRIITPSEYELEVRIFKRLKKLFGRFFYNRTATVKNTGTVRKERFKPHAFRYSVDRIEKAKQDLDAKLKGKASKEEIEAAEDEVKNADINILVGHDFGKPLGSVARSTARVKDTPEALEFEVDLPEKLPAHMQDVLDQIDADLITGISPGFKLPPSNINPNAESFEDEPGNPGVKIRNVNDAILYEVSLVTRPAYAGTELSVRSKQDEFEQVNRRMIWL